MISEENGQYLVGIAKEAVLNYLDKNMKIEVPEDCPDELKEKMGVRWRILWYFISAVIVGAGCLSAMILGLDYEYHAVLIGYFLYIFHEKPVWAIPFCYLAMYKEPWALLGF